MLTTCALVMHYRMTLNEVLDLSVMQVVVLQDALATLKGAGDGGDD